MTLRAQQLAVTVTCLVAAVSYAGAVTTEALGWFVLPAVAGAALFASLLVAHRLSGTALIVGGLLALGWSELVNIWSGTGDGPAARSTFFAAGWTLVAVVAADSRWPALFLEGAAGVVAGAVVLGAGGEVRVVAVATAVCAAFTLALLERSRRNWTASPRRSVGLVLLSLLVAAVAAGVVLVQDQKDPRQPEALAAGRAYPGIKPPWTDPLGTVSKPLGGPSQQSNSAAQRSSRSSPPRPNRPHTRPKNHPPKSKSKSQSPQSRPHARQHHAPPPKHSAKSRAWLYVLAAMVLAVLLLALLVVVRLLVTRTAWRRVRRRLAAGSHAEQVTGAWAWTRMRLDASRLSLAADASPDAVAAGRAGDAVPADVFAPLRELATTTTTAAFAHDQSITARQVDAAWAAAGRAEASARDVLTRRGRVRLAFRGPARKVPARR